MTTEAGFEDLVEEFFGELSFDPNELREKYRLERDKRLRPDGPDQYVKVAENPDAARLSRDVWVEPGFTRDPLFDEVETAIIGAGFAGLVMGARLREAGFEDIRLIDKAADVGGTWYWNRYPGLNCDIESYVYFPLLEETGYVPKHKYSFGPEIFEYCQIIARKYGLYKNSCFQTAVTELCWDEADGRWIISTDQGDRMRARYIVLAPGAGTNRMKLPGIPGLTDFKGHSFHASRWDYTYTGGDTNGNMTELADKRVGVIGTGATAVQIVPHLAESAKHVYVFQRTPSSVGVRGNRETDPDWAESLTPGWHQERQDNFMAIAQGDGAEVDLVDDGFTATWSKLLPVGARRDAEAKLGRRISTDERRGLTEVADFEIMNAIRARIDNTVKDPATAESLKPWYRNNCKRPCWHDSYLDAFNNPNVDLIDTDGKGVDRLTENGVVANGEEYEIDCLIYVLGFSVTGGARAAQAMGCPIIGRDGLSLVDRWSEVPSALWGLMTDGFPNCFFLPGPQNVFSILLTYTYSDLSLQTAHILDVARRRGLRTVEASTETVQEWSDTVVASQRYGTEAFFSSCTPGYYNNEGKVPTSVKKEGGKTFVMSAGGYGGGPQKYIEILRDWRAQEDCPGIEMR